MRIRCRSLVLLLAAGACAGPGPQQAAGSNPGAEACATQLSPKASAIYHDIAPHMTPDTNLETIMRERVMMMIVSGDMSMGAARPAAEKAADCLGMLQH